jgi:hypothetical protein
VPQIWPPAEPLDDIVAIDLDGDAATDFVASIRGSLYFLQGGVDVLPGAAPLVAYSLKNQLTGTEIGLLPVRSPPRILLAESKRAGTFSLEIRTNGLSEIESELTSDGDLEWISVTNDSTIIERSSGVTSTVRLTPAGEFDTSSRTELLPPEGGWSDESLAAEYSSGGERKLVLASPTRVIQTSLDVLPIGASWEVVRGDGTWEAQTYVGPESGLGDGFVGVVNEPEPQLCFLSFTSRSAVCGRIGGTGPLRNSSMIVGHLETESRLDAVLVYQQGDGQAFQIFSDLRSDSQSLFSASLPVAVFRQGESPMKVLRGDGLSSRPSVLLVDHTGSFNYCFAVLSGDVTGCATP